MNTQCSECSEFAQPDSLALQTQPRPLGIWPHTYMYKLWESWELWSWGQLSVCNHARCEENTPLVPSLEMPQFHQNRETFWTFYSLVKTHKPSIAPRMSQIIALSFVSLLALLVSAYLDLSRLFILSSILQ